MKEKKDFRYASAALAPVGHKEKKRRDTKKIRKSER